MLSLQQKHLSTYDNTKISYYTGGVGPRVILANGLGGPHISYRHILAELGADYRVLTWDYRGFFGSDRPSNLSDLSVAHQVRDLELLMENESIDEAIVVGWSMGVQVALELYRRRPKNVAGLVLCCGAAGVPFQTLGIPWAETLVPKLTSLGKRNAKLLSAISKRSSWSGTVPLMKRLGLVAGSLDTDLFHDLIEAFLNMDMEVYCETLRQLGQHDARDVLPTVCVPTLLVAGQHDRMTPARISKVMHQSIPSSRLVVVEGGTHYTPIEFPTLVASELNQFLRRVPGYEPLSHRTQASV